MILYKNCKIVSDGKIYTGDILEKDGIIVKTDHNINCEDAKIIDLNGNYISPGFIDIHCHGGNNKAYIDGTEEAVNEVSNIHYDHGTRIIYPTISATDYDTMYKALYAIEASKNNCKIKIPGVHLEGPYLTLEKGSGQAATHVRKPDKKEYEALFERFGNLISRWTFAPEEDKDYEFLKFLINNNIVASAGHTNATYEDMKKAYEYGCNLITHLYSCTSTITRKDGFRILGVTECAYLFDDMYVEAIADGKHLPLELLQLIVKLKGADKTILITDSLWPGGLGKELEGTEYLDCDVPFVVEDGVLKLLDHSAFAGSIATTDILLKTAIEAGISLEDAIKMLTKTPAKIMNLKNLGSIKEGYEAIFTIFDKDYNIMEIDKGKSRVRHKNII